MIAGPGAHVGAPFHVRPANADDVGRLAAIWHAGWFDGHLGSVPTGLLAHRTFSEFERRTRNRIAATTVAVRHGEVVGFVVVIGDEVEQLYVAAEARGTGAADMLLQHAETVIALDHESAWLAVIGGNGRARRFYERSGWHNGGEFDNLAETADGRMPVRALRYEKPLVGDRGRSR